MNLSPFIFICKVYRKWFCCLMGILRISQPNIIIWWLCVWIECSFEGLYFSLHYIFIWVIYVIAQYTVCVETFIPSIFIITVYLNSRGMFYLYLICGIWFSKIFSWLGCVCVMILNSLIFIVSWMYSYLLLIITL